MGVKAELEHVANEFVAYYSRGGGCSNCGGLPHTTTCFVGRFQKVLAAAVPHEGPQETLREQVEKLDWWRPGLSHIKWVNRAQVLALLDSRRDAAAPSHQCAGCHHRWEGDLKGAELCGDCWRKAQPMVHRRDAAAPLVETHLCAGCHHRWEGPFKGAQLCGDCWRRGQRAIFGGNGEVTLLTDVMDLLAELEGEVAEFAVKDDPYFNGIRRCIDGLKAIELPTIRDADESSQRDAAAPVGPHEEKKETK